MADYLFKNNRRGSAIQIFSRGSVSAEMAIRSAATGISTTLGFTETGSLIAKQMLIQNFEGKHR
jgi:hypothetical protein